MILNINKNQGALPENKLTSIPSPANTLSNTSRADRFQQADDTDEDPLLKEGYLPEIYFLLKSDNPADW